mgnify:CR=1 FL=1
MKFESTTELKRFFENVKSNRSAYDKDLQQINYYLSPSSKNFLSSGPDGTANREPIYNNSAERNSDDLVSSLINMVVYPIEDKFYLKPSKKNQKLNSKEKNYLAEAKDEIVHHLALNKSYFLAAASNIFQNIVNYGDGPWIAERDTGKKIVKFASLPKQEVYVQRDIFGEAQVYFREVKMNALQIKKEFFEKRVLDKCEYTQQDWDKFETKMKSAPNEEWVIVQCVYERDEFTKNGVGSEKQFASIWLDHAQGKVIRDSGFDYMPFRASAWKLLSGEDYGRGPGHRAIDDIKTLNMMERDNMAASGIMLIPPVTMPYDLMDDEPDFSQAAINYINVSKAMFNLGITKPETMNVIQDLPMSVQMQDRKDAAISRAFYADLLQDTKANLEQSATEAAQNKVDRIGKMTRPLLCIRSTFLQEVLEIVYDSLVEFKVLKPPETLKRLDIAFTDAIYQAQQAAKLQLLERALAAGANFKALPPDLQASVEESEFLPTIFDMVGADPRFLKDSEEAQEAVETERKIRQDNVDTQSLRNLGGGVNDLQKAFQTSQQL